jgi:acyl dehydratase
LLAGRLTTLLFFDDIVAGQRAAATAVSVDGSKMVAFAQIWDPLPIHVDAEVAKRETGGLTALGLYTLALKQRLLHAAEQQAAVIASLDYDEVRFYKPVRAGARLTLMTDWTDKRSSISRPDRGIVTRRPSLVVEAGELVMCHLETLLVRCRPVN